MHWFTFRKRKAPPVTGLILPGGGARNAYQAGVIKAVAELIPGDADNPFPSPGQITGYVFDTLFMDSLDADI